MGILHSHKMWQQKNRTLQAKAPAPSTGLPPPKLPPVKESLSRMNSFMDLDPKKNPMQCSGESWRQVALAPMAHLARARIARPQQQQIPRQSLLSMDKRYPIMVMV